MNVKNWQNGEHPDEVWLAKLGEEFGEVARAYLRYKRAESAKDPAKAGIKARRQDLWDELTHVTLIANNFRRQIERSRA